MKTTVQIPAVLRKYSNEELTVTFDGATVADLLQELRQLNFNLYNCICDETGQLRQHVNIFVNDGIVHRDGLTTLIPSNAVVSVFQAVSGG